MPVLPGVVSTDHTPRNVLLTDQATKLGLSITLDSTNTDSGSSPTHWFRPGNVVVLDTSEGVYVEADDALADSSAGASVSASETADTDWQSATITVELNGGTSHTVTLGAADDTDAEVVTALNGDAVFAANLIADVNASVVRIRTLQGGSDVSLLVTSSLATAFGASGTSASGTDADYRVTSSFGYLQDEVGTAHDFEVSNFMAGHFDESQLIIAGAAATASPAWADAKRVLVARGSIFG